MDITASNKKLCATKLFNGETINFGTSFLAVSFLFIVFKQLLKTSFEIGASVSVLISFVVSAAVLFLVEKRFVFTHAVKNKTPIQVLLYILRCAIDIGFYKICDFIFGSVLNLGNALIFLICGVIVLFFNYYFDRLIVFDCRSNPVNNYRGRLYKLFFSNRFVLLSMLASLACILIVFLIFSLFPFGDLTVMRMDLYHQYGPLFCEFYDRVVNHESFIYSWVSGGGSSFIGNYFNYLSSPLSFIVLLFDRKEISFAITTLVITKSVLSAGAFSYYLKKSLGSHSFASASFGIFYAFCGYFLAYYWNIMWIDAMYLFPFVVLGIEKIINDKKPLCYIISLTILIYCSYYMAYMVSIFSIIYFIAYFAITSGKKNPLPLVKEKKVLTLSALWRNRFINRGVIFALSSLLCGALCAIVLIPLFFILQASSATSDAFPTTFEGYFDLVNLLSSHFAALETTIRSSGDDVLPNIYCSMLAAILVPLYIVNKNIRLKEKTAYVLIIIFFVFSFDNNIANFIWHGLHFPNDLPYRFSFMYSFIILVIAFKALKNIRSLDIRDIGFVGLFWVFIVLFFQKFPTNKISDFTLYITLAFIMIWTLVLMLIRRGKFDKVLLGLTILAVAFSEVIVADTPSYSFSQKQSDYVENYDTYEEAIDYIYDNGSDFYRTELCYLDTRMDPCLYGYRGISTFSSMAYEKYSGLQYSLGMFGNRINSYTYNTQTPLYNMMFALKYLIHSDEGVTPSDDFYENVYKTENGEGSVYKNKYAMPIAFTVNSGIKDWEFSEGNPFEVQEDFIDKAAGVSNLFIPVEYVSTETESASSDEVTENGTFFFEKDDPESELGTIDVTIKAQNESNLYVYITSPKIENVNYYWNDEEESKYQNIDEPYIMDLGKHKKGDEIRISLSCAEMDIDSSYFEIYAYNIDKDVFASAYELLKLGAIDVNSWSDTHIEGTVNAGYDGYLYTSIPYDEGWSVYIDGKKANTFETGDCMLTTKITKGEHIVKYKFTPRGIKYGAAVTAGAWFIILILFLYYRIRRRKTKDAEIC